MWATFPMSSVYPSGGAPLTNRVPTVALTPGGGGGEIEGRASVELTVVGGDAAGSYAGSVSESGGCSKNVLSPGTYGFVCFVPAPDGRPHAEHGMFGEFTVS